MVCTIATLATVAVGAIADQPAEPDPPPAELPNAGYDRRFFIQSSDGAYRLNIGGRLQARFTLSGTEEADTGEIVESYAFLIPRARLMMSGHFFTPDLSFAFNTEFGKGEVPANKDALIDYRVVPEVFHVRFGQWKKPIDRQWIAAIGDLMFIERPITHPYFGTTRDIGIAVHNGVEEAPLVEYAVGVFNGTGEIGIFDAATGKQSNIPDRVKPVIVARLAYNHGGIRPFSELDFEGGPPRFAVGLGAQAFLDADDSGEGRVVAVADFVFKAYGFTTMGAAYLAYRQAEGEPFKEQRYEASGMYVSAGYLIGRIVQPGVRYARIFRAGGDNDTQEVTGVVGVHPFESSRFKLDVDGGAILDESPNGTRTGFLVRNQLHLDF